VKSLYVCTDPLLTMNKLAINLAAEAKGLPTMYQFRDHVVARGLMSYGPDFTKMFEDTAALVSRFMRTGDLPPIAEPDENRFELVWNRTIAAALRLHNDTGNIPSGFQGVIIG
jgi:putative tryptophan/tyrosine transport system substrate-binding protein